MAFAAIDCLRAGVYIRRRFSFVCFIHGAKMRRLFLATTTSKFPVILLEARRLYLLMRAIT